ncbi:Gmad2 immunoglobulin-like domain-containing protein [Halalkalibacter kiskunsagensis]|uniref:Gmad2 immunoglobulin-like domain-containing protein n=1 Tax=Halalkalibacter kiskunsagensis TaxID=1548599 RepID=A0ABV6KDX5_9BACI
MKKMAYLLAILTTTVSLVACSQQEEGKELERENTSVTVPEDAEEITEVVVEENKEQKPKDESKTNPVEPDSNRPDETVYYNEVFKDVVVAESEDEMIVTGKAQVFEGVFQYALYDGEEVLLEYYYQTDGAPNWGEFEINFEKELVSTIEAKFELFVYSAKDGSKVNTLEIIIPKP